MRTKRDIKQIWIWLPLILTVAAYTVFVTATVVLYIASRTNIIHAFAFRNFAVRLFVPMVFPVLLIVLHKIQSRGLHTTMAALNFAVIVLFDCVFMAVPFQLLRLLRRICRAALSVLFRRLRLCVRSVSVHFRHA